MLQVAISAHSSEAATRLFERCGNPAKHHAAITPVLHVSRVRGSMSIRRESYWPSCWALSATNRRDTALRETADCATSAGSGSSVPP